MQLGLDGAALDRGKRGPQPRPERVSEVLITVDRLEDQEVHARTPVANDPLANLHRCLSRWPTKKPAAKVTLDRRPHERHGKRPRAARSCPLALSRLQHFGLELDPLGC